MKNVVTTEKCLFISLPVSRRLLLVPLLFTGSEANQNNVEECSLQEANNVSTQWMRNINFLMEFLLFQGLAWWSRFITTPNQIVWQLYHHPIDIFREGKVVIWPSIQSLMRQEVPSSLDCSNEALISLATLSELIFRFSGFAFRHLQLSSLTLVAWKIVCNLQAWLLWWIMRAINETRLLLLRCPHYSNDPQWILSTPTVAPTFEHFGLLTTSINIQDKRKVPETWFHYFNM